MSLIFALSLATLGLCMLGAAYLLGREKQQALRPVRVKADQSRIK